MKLIAVYWKLFRVPNALALSFLFVASKLYFSGQPLVPTDFITAFVWLCLAAFAYAFNDYCDISIDRINNPNRPLPSNQIGIKRAQVATWAPAIMALALSSILIRPLPIWPGFVLALAVAYSLIVRTRSTLASNLLASVLVALIPLTSSSFVWESRLTSFSIGLGLLIFARELQKDFIDSIGDAKYRPPALLLGRYAHYASLAYPVILVTSFLLIYFGLEKAQNAILVVFGPLYLLAIQNYATPNRSARFQERVEKAVCYLLVPFLIFGAFL